jgi:hypothetical protein
LASFKTAFFVSELISLEFLNALETVATEIFRLLARSFMVIGFFNEMAFLRSDLQVLGKKLKLKQPLLKFKALSFFINPESVPVF